MSKIDTNVINNIKMLSLDMINEAGSGDCKLALNTTTMLYNLFLNHLNYNKTNPNWINRDRIIVNNKMLPVMYSTLHMFGYNISIDSLREYKKLNSITGGYNNPSTTGIEIGSISTGDIISSAIGIALGERYIESLIKIENPKCELINFYTYLGLSLIGIIFSETITFSTEIIYNSI